MTITNMISALKFIFKDSVILTLSFISIFCFVAVAIITVIGSSQNDKIRQCAAKGGVYLTQEKLCVDIKTIPLDK